MGGDRFLAMVGALVIVAGGFALAGLLCGLAVDYCWRRLRQAVLLIHVQRAIREYRERHPDADLSRYMDERGSA